MRLTIRTLGSALFGTLPLVLSNTAQAQFTLSEILVNPPGGDNGREAVEIRGPANASLSGYWLLMIDGDGAQAGIVDVRQDLGGYTTGSNGLLLIRDSPVVIAPAPAPATNVVIHDWSPNIENGTTTFVLGFGTPPALGADLDVDNDGTLDPGALDGFDDSDAVTLIQNDVSADNHVYADDLGCFACPQLPFTPDALYAIYNADGSQCCWTGGDLTATNPDGPFMWDVAGGNVFGGLTGGGLNLGDHNIIIDSDGDGIGDGCEMFTAYCFGDGSVATACPCSNNGTSGRGCDNSAGTGGAELVPAGDVMDDTVVLTSSGELPNSLSIFLQGDTSAAAGAVFGDGVRCAGGNLLRLYVKSAVGGTASAPAGSDPSIMTRSEDLGDMLGMGMTRYYQVYYRDPSLTFCTAPTGNTFNISGAVAIIW